MKLIQCKRQLGSGSDCICSINWPTHDRAMTGWFLGLPIQLSDRFLLYSVCVRTPTQRCWCKIFLFVPHAVINCYSLHQRNIANSLPNIKIKINTFIESVETVKVTERCRVKSEISLIMSKDLNMLVIWLMSLNLSAEVYSWLSCVIFLLIIQLTFFFFYHISQSKYLCLLIGMQRYF